MPSFLMSSTDYRRGLATAKSPWRFPRLAGRLLRRVNATVYYILTLFLENLSCYVCTIVLIIYLVILLAMISSRCICNSPVQLLYVFFSIFQVFDFHSLPLANGNITFLDVTVRGFSFFSALIDFTSLIMLDGAISFFSKKRRLCCYTPWVCRQNPPLA